MDAIIAQNQGRFLTTTMRADISSLRNRSWLLTLTVAGFLITPASLGASAQTATGNDNRAAQQVHPSLAAGRLLIADRSLGDPNFSETVVLLLKVTDSGTIGVVINDRIETRVADIFPQIEALAEEPDLALYGGPVAKHLAMVLIRSPIHPVTGENIFDDVWLAAGEAPLQQAVDDDTMSFRVYLGYAGWAPGQLEAEVARHDWQILPADASLIFDLPAPEIWPELIRRSRTLLAVHRPLSRLHPISIAP